jgi:hypothetical protein
MLRYARFAVLAGLAGGIPVINALDPPPQAQQQKQEKRDDTRKAEPVKGTTHSYKQGAPKEGGGDDRIDRRNTRMKERDREIDRMVNKPKK